MGASRLFWQLVLAFAAVNLVSDLALWSLAQQATERPWQFWIVLTAVVCLPLCAAFAIVWKTIRPLESLTRRAQRLAGENSERSTALGMGRDEVWQLTEAFEQIQQQLEARVTQFQQYSQRLSTVLESMVEGVLAIDDQQRVLFANDASLVMLEIATRDIIGRPLVTLTRSLPIHEAVGEAARLGQPQQTELYSAGAVRRLLSLRATPLPGRPCPGVVVVLHDLTDLRRLESMRREFVANVSHELKTPLAAIKAFAETLRLGALRDPDHSLQFVVRIEEQAERLHRLILDLLQLARVETGREAFEFTDVRVAETVLHCVESHTSRAATKQLAFEVAAGDPRVCVRADAGGLRTILDNLLSNAINYTPEGGSIAVRCIPDAAFVALQVQDSGIGIAPQHQDRIFERFYRVDRARAREPGGTGLGLAIVKHLCQAFGGSVQVASELGNGATFTVRLPRAPDAGV